MINMWAGIGSDGATIGRTKNVKDNANENEVT